MPRVVEVRMYEGTTHPFCTILPDHTGHYLYPTLRLHHRIERASMRCDSP